MVWRPGAIANRAWLDGDGPVAKAALCGQVRLRGDADAAPGSLVQLARVRTARSVADPHRSGVPRPGAAHRADGGGDHVVIERDQILSGIGLISNAGARFEAPETISPQGRFEDVHRGGYDPEQHLRDMALDGVAGEVLYPSQGLFYFKVADTALMSAIFRAYNDWLAEFCRTDPARLKGIATRAERTTSGSGSYPGGQATTKCAPKRALIRISE